MVDLLLHLALTTFEDLVIDLVDPGFVRAGTSVGVLLSFFDEARELTNLILEEILHDTSEGSLHAGEGARLPLRQVSTPHEVLGRRGGVRRRRGSSRRGGRCRFT